MTPQELTLMKLALSGANPSGTSAAGSGVNRNVISGSASSPPSPNPQPTPAPQQQSASPGPRIVQSGDTTVTSHGGPRDPSPTRPGTPRVGQEYIDLLNSLGMERSLELARSGGVDEQFKEAVNRFYLGQGQEANAAGGNRATQMRNAARTGSPRRSPSSASPEIASASPSSNAPTPPQPRPNIPVGSGGGDEGIREASTQQVPLSRMGPGTYKQGTPMTPRTAPGASSPTSPPGIGGQASMSENQAIREANAPVGSFAGKNATGPLGRKPSSGGITPQEILAMLMAMGSPQGPPSQGPSVGRPESSPMLGDTAINPALLQAAAGRRLGR